MPGQERAETLPRALPASLRARRSRVFGNPEGAACKLLKLAHSFEPVQDGRIPIEKINAPMPYEHKATPAEYKAGLDLAIERGWMDLHESVRLYASPRPARTCSHRKTPP